jgi:DNA-binding transcriptional MerR regulator
MDQVLDEFSSWRDKFAVQRLPLWDELTDIELYMDQVTGLLQKYLSVYVKDEADRLVSASMINNYVKMGLISPPVNKRYGKSQIAALIMICVLKQVLSISDIKSLLAKKLQTSGISCIYDEFCAEQQSAGGQMLSLCGCYEGGESEYAGIAFRAAILANAGKAISGKLIDIQNKAEEEKRSETVPEDKNKKKQK